MHTHARAHVWAVHQARDIVAQSATEMERERAEKAVELQVGAPCSRLLHRCARVSAAVCAHVDVCRAACACGRYPPRVRVHMRYGVVVCLRGLFRCSRR
jgi:hypothetical protein